MSRRATTGAADPTTRGSRALLPGYSPIHDPESPYAWYDADGAPTDRFYDFARDSAGDEADERREREMQQ